MKTRGALLESMFQRAVQAFNGGDWASVVLQVGEALSRFK